MIYTWVVNEYGKFFKRWRHNELCNTWPDLVLRWFLRKPIRAPRTGDQARPRVADRRALCREILLNTDTI